MSVDERPYVQPEASQSERRAVLEADRRGREPQTYFERQQIDADAPGGRFARLNPVRLTGTAPGPTYPRLPASSPWARDPVPDEPLCDGCCGETYGIDVGGASPAPADIDAGGPDGTGSR